MKLTVVFLSFLSTVLARDAKQLSSPLAYSGYPYAGAGLAGPYGSTAAPYYAGYAGNPYAGNIFAGYPYAGQGYAGYPYGGLPYGAYPYPYAIAPLVESKSVETPTLPTVSYDAVQAMPYAPAQAVPYAAPAPAPVPYSTGTQFHAQDEFGNLNYGYTNIDSAKQEVGNTYGGVTGEYSYVDANGGLQKVQYIADDAGFRVADSRLPKAPTFNPEPLVAPTFNPDLPIAPVDTPEVAAAKEAHFAAVEAVEAAEAAEAAMAADAPNERKRRAARFSYGVRTYHPTNAYKYAGLPQAAGYAGHQYLGLPHGAGYGYAGLGYGMPYYG